MRINCRNWHIEPPVSLSIADVPDFSTYSDEFMSVDRLIES